MKEHSRLYNEMPPEERGALEHRALLARSSSMAGIQEDIQHNQALIALEETRSREEELELGNLMLVSNCRFSGDDIEQLQTFVDSAPLSRADVQRLRKEAVAGPKATPPAVLEAMSRVYAPSGETPTAHPSWLRDVCSCRDSLRGSAIGFESAAGTSWYLFVYASQSPYAASFVPMQKHDSELPNMHTVGEVLSYATTQSDHAFV
jgi:hypothetical protein